MEKRKRSRWFPLFLFCAADGEKGKERPQAEKKKIFMRKRWGMQNFLKSPKKINFPEKSGRTGKETEIFYSDLRIKRKTGREKK